MDTDKFSLNNNKTYYGDLVGKVDEHDGKTVST